MIYEAHLKTVHRLSRRLVDLSIMLRRYKPKNLQKDNLAFQISNASNTRFSQKCRLKGIIFKDKMTSAETSEFSAAMFLFWSQGILG